MSAHLPIRTERLLLRPFTDSPADEAALLALFRAPAYRRYLTDRPGAEIVADTPEKVRALLDACRSDVGELLAVEREGEVIGQAGIFPGPRRGELAIGLGLHPAAWGHGFAQEIATRLVDEVRAAPYVHAVVAETRGDNAGARRVLERIGLFHAATEQGRAFYRAPAGPVLETERLVLREMSPHDLDFFAPLLSDPEVMRFYPRCYSREEARGWIGRNLERYHRDGHGLWLAIEKERGLPVGQVGVIEQEKQGLRFSEVGYMFAAAAWGRGLATEGARGALQWAFERLGRRRMHAMIRPENVPSQRVARRLGMRPGPRIEHAGFGHDLWFLDR